MHEVLVTSREWRGLAGLVLQALVVVALACAARDSDAQASSALAVNLIVCGPAGASGVTYVSVSNHPASCGTDANGNLLAPQVSRQFVAMNVDDTTDDGGAAAGIAIGGAVFALLAVAFGFRLLRNFINSSSEG